MSTYQVNRGVGKPIEFFGLRAQYVLYLIFLNFLIIIFSFILSMVLNAVVALFIGIVSSLLAICSCYRLNNIYGEYGLVQKFAYRNVIKHISVCKRIYQLVEDRDEKIK